MNTVILLTEARRLGVRLTARGERLVVDAPAPLPDSLVAALRAHKEELLAFMGRPEAHCQDADRRESIREAATEIAGRFVADGLSVVAADRAALLLIRNEADREIARLHLDNLPKLPRELTH